MTDRNSRFKWTRWLLSRRPFQDQLSGGSLTLDLMLEPTLLEATSWRIASLLARRHPELRIRREHPGGGMYNVLAVRGGPHAIMLNRNGTIQVHPKSGGADVQLQPLEWSAVITRNIREVVNVLEGVAGLPTVPHLPTSTPRVLAYRCLSALANLHLFATPIDIQMALHDSSGPGGSGPSPWADDYDGLRTQLTSDRDGARGEDLWNARNQSINITFDTSAGTYATPRTPAQSLAEAYERAGRRMPLLVSTVLEEGVVR